MKAEIDRLRSAAESDLIAQVDTPTHIPFTSRTGAQLVGKTSVFWDRTQDPGSIAATVDVCEAKRGRARSIAQGSFIRFADGRLTDRTYDPYASRVIRGVPGGAFHDGAVTALHLDTATQTLQLDMKFADRWAIGTLSLRFEDVTDYELTELNDDDLYNTVMGLQVVVADDGRLDVELQSSYPSLGVEDRFRCASIVEA